MRIFNLVMIAFVLTGLVSCKDEKEEGCMDPLSISYNPDAEKDDGSCQYGGTGGATEVVIFPQHNNVAVLSTAAYPDTCYIKFNAVEAPGIGTTGYDGKIVGTDGEDHIHFYGMKPGKYYVYITGWDTNANKRVAGGMAITVTQAAGTVNIVVPTF
jgi:hypothetical protein